MNQCHFHRFTHAAATTKLHLLLTYCFHCWPTTTSHLLVVWHLLARNGNKSINSNRISLPGMGSKIEHSLADLPMLKVTIAIVCDSSQSSISWKAEFFLLLPVQIYEELLYCFFFIISSILLFFSLCRRDFLPLMLDFNSRWLDSETEF